MSDVLSTHMRRYFTQFKNHGKWSTSSYVDMPKSSRALGTGFHLLIKRFWLWSYIVSLCSATSSREGDFSWCRPRSHNLGTSPLLWGNSLEISIQGFYTAYLIDPFGLSSMALNQLRLQKVRLKVQAPPHTGCIISYDEVHLIQKACVFLWLFYVLTHFDHLG